MLKFNKPNSHPKQLYSFHEWFHFGGRNGSELTAAPESGAQQTSAPENMTTDEQHQGDLQVCKKQTPSQTSWAKFSQDQHCQVLRAHRKFQKHFLQCLKFECLQHVRQDSVKDREWGYEEKK